MTREAKSWCWFAILFAIMLLFVFLGFVSCLHLTSLPIILTSTDLGHTLSSRYWYYYKLASADIVVLGMTSFIVMVLCVRVIRILGAKLPKVIEIIYWVLLCLCIFIVACGVYGFSNSP